MYQNIYETINDYISVWRMVLHILLMVFGVSFVAVGIVNYVMLEKYADFLPTMASPWIHILMGIFISVTSILGFCEVKKNFLPCSKAFFFILVVLLVLECRDLLWSTAHVLYGRKITDEYLIPEIKKYKYSIASKKNWDTLQTNLRCCGVGAPWNWNATAIPASCCFSHAEVSGQEESPVCISYSNKRKYLAYTGCSEKLLNLCMPILYVKPIIALPAALVTLFGCVILFFQIEASRQTED